MEVHYDYLKCRNTEDDTGDCQKGGEESIDQVDTSGVERARLGKWHA